MPFNTVQIKELLEEQRQDFISRDLGVPRFNLDFVKKQLDSHYALVVSGLRRSGKSTFLAQVARNFYPQENFLYINFDDERFLDFDAKDFSKLHEILIEMYGDHKIFFLDEVQNISRWESFVRRLIDQNNKLYITGSNAALLSKELGSKLTGRYMELENFPFSFQEFLDFNDVNYKQKRGGWDTGTKAILKKYLGEYLFLGSIPEALRYPELPVLKRLYQDAIYRNISARYNIDSDKLLRELSYFVFSNLTSSISFSKLKSNLGIGSVSTVTNYVSHLESAWLIFMINIYDHSVKRQQIAPKKVYAIDTGLAREVAFSFSKNKEGALFENLIFLALRRKQKEIFYYKTKSGYEVDFYIPEIGSLIQVAYDISSQETREREIRALIEAKDELDAKELILVTYDHHEEILEDSNQIKVIPAYELLLDVVK